MTNVGDSWGHSCGGDIIPRELVLGGGRSDFES